MDWGEIRAQLADADADAVYGAVLASAARHEPCPLCGQYMLGDGSVHANYEVRDYEDLPDGGYPPDDDNYPPDSPQSEDIP